MVKVATLSQDVDSSQSTGARSKSALGEVVLPLSILPIEFTPQVAESITKLVPISSTKGFDVEDNVPVVERLEGRER